MKIKMFKKEASQSSNNGLLNKNSPAEIKDAYTQLRTNLLFSMTEDKGRQCKTFAVASPSASADKSVTAANIAISFAMLGKKTILIDADMRSSGQRKLWKNRSQAGLCDFLANIMPLEVYSVEDIPLSVVFTGTLPYNPTELMSTEKLSDFIKECAEHYEYVIIDSPAVNLYADTQILSSYVDGVILISQSGTTAAKEINAAAEKINLADGRLCGVVINGVKTPKEPFFRLKLPRLR